MFSFYSNSKVSVLSPLHERKANTATLSRAQHLRCGPCEGLESARWSPDLVACLFLVPASVDVMALQLPPEALTAIFIISWTGWLIILLLLCFNDLEMLLLHPCIFVCKVGYFIVVCVQSLRCRNAIFCISFIIDAPITFSAVIIDAFNTIIYPPRPRAGADLNSISRASSLLRYFFVRVLLLGVVPQSSVWWPCWRVTLQYPV